MPANALVPALKRSARSVAHKTGFTTAASQTRRGQVAVLVYHRVDPVGHVPGSVTLELFEQQMRHLARWYRAVSTDEAAETAAGTHRGERFGVCVQFDDGYRSTGEYAWPVMKKLGIPLTIYVVADVAGTGRRLWFDELQVRMENSVVPSLTVETEHGPSTLDLQKGGLWESCGRVKSFLRSLSHADMLSALDQIFAVLPEAEDKFPDSNDLMDWAAIRSLASDGVTIGHHTLTHPIVTQLSQAELTHEVAAGRRVLEEKLGRPVNTFCYPNGVHSPREVEAARAAGFGNAVTCVEGTVHAGADPLQLPRIAAAENSVADFSYRLMRPTG